MLIWKTYISYNLGKWTTTHTDRDLTRVLFVKARKALNDRNKQLRRLIQKLPPEQLDTSPATLDGKYLVLEFVYIIRSD